jgi:hypothetical protein
MNPYDDCWLENFHGFVGGPGCDIENSDSYFDSASVDGMSMRTKGRVDALQVLIPPEVNLAAFKLFRNFDFTYFQHPLQGGYFSICVEISILRIFSTHFKVDILVSGEEMSCHAPLFVPFCRLIRSADSITFM